MALVSDEEWADYKQQFEKSYKDAAEEIMRRELYAKSKATIEAHNRKYEAGETTYTMGINHLADLTEAEYAMMCGCRPPPSNT